MRCDGVRSGEAMDSRATNRRLPSRSRARASWADVIGTIVYRNAFVRSGEGRGRADNTIEVESPSSARFGWKCPECGRQIPRSVEVCRCGVERRRLEALGYNFDRAPNPAESVPTSARAASESDRGLAGTLVGYRSTADVSRAWRIVFTLLFLTLVGGAGYLVVTYTHLPLPPTRENVDIVATLEGHTKAAGKS